MLVSDLELPAFDHTDPSLRGERFHEEMARLRSKAYIGRYDEDLILSGLRRRLNELK